MPLSMPMARTDSARSGAVPVAQAHTEFLWSDGDFARVQALIHQRAGIHLHNGKHAMVYSRLSRRLRETGHGSFRAYLAWLEQHGGGEWQEFINALTTNLTAFFREPHHFEILSGHLKTRPAGAPWRLWCSAASTGEEAYSILMTALETLGAAADVRLVASDIDTRVLASAAQGIYRQDSTKALSPQQLQRFFLRGKGANADMVRAFRARFDVVFCRNVMIYFDAQTQRQVLERMHRVLQPGGLLFVGHAENFTASADLFTLRGKTVYERR